MKDKLTSKPNNLNRFILFGVVLCLVIFTVENINGRFNLNDFKVYYSAASSLLQGEQVYGVPFGLETGYYKYSPFSLLFFLPYCVVPFEVARNFHFVVLVFVTISAIILLKRVFNNHFFTTDKLNAPLIVSFICVVIHLVRELHLGNINVVLVLLTCLAVQATVQKKHLKAGLLFGAIVMTKPYFLLLLLPLVAHTQFKTIAALCISILAYVLVPAVFLGISKDIQLHQEWVSAMFAHDDYLKSTNTLEYLVQYYITPAVQYMEVLSIALAGLFYLILFWYNRQSAGKDEAPSFKNEQAYILESFILIALIPNLVVTDTEHFLYSLPLIILIVSYLYEKKSLVYNICFAILIFFYGGNSSDLLGKKLAARFDEWGVLGISNLLLIALVTYLYVTEKSRWTGTIKPGKI